MAETVGFIGLGIMGKPMARHLANAGYDVVIHTLNQETIKTFTAESDKFIAAANAERGRADRRKSSSPCFPTRRR